MTSKKLVPYLSQSSIQVHREREALKQTGKNGYSDEPSARVNPMIQSSSDDDNTPNNVINLMDALKKSLSMPKEKKTKAGAN